MRSPFNSRSLRCLLAVLHKNWTLKKRAWKTTICELVSPSLFLSILVLGYYLSNVRTFAPSIYSATQLEVGPLLDAARPLLQNADIRASAQCAGRPRCLGFAQPLASALLQHAADMACSCIQEWISQKLSDAWASDQAQGSWHS